jgi:hypothetical protein
VTDATLLDETGEAPQATQIDSEILGMEHGWSGAATVEGSTPSRLI